MVRKPGRQRREGLEVVLISDVTNFKAIAAPAHGHDDRVKMAAACCPTVMAGHVPATSRDRFSLRMAGTRPATTVGWALVHCDFEACDVERPRVLRQNMPLIGSYRPAIDVLVGILDLIPNDKHTMSRGEIL